MKLVPYKHPMLGWYFDWYLISLLDGGFRIGPNWFVIKWNAKQPLRYKPTKIQRTYNDGPEPAMYIWLKFNISFVGGWGTGLTYK